MDFVFELIVSVLIVFGGVFALIGSFGMLKLPDLLTRLHAPTKATTLGVGGALAASMVYFAAFEGSLTIHEVLVTAFLFLTAPISAHFIAKAHLHEHAELREGLPPTGRPNGWSTFDGVPAPDEDDEAGDDRHAAHH